MFASSSIKMSDHLRNVFSLTPTKTASVVSILYPFNSNKAHKRWSGFEFPGRTSRSRSHATKHTSGVVPKNALNLRWPTLRLPCNLWPVMLWPIRQKVSIFRKIFALSMVGFDVIH